MDDQKNEPTVVVVRRYGLRQPLDWGTDCDDEMRRMTALWNNLVAIEAEHRVAFVALTAADPKVRALEAKVKALVRIVEKKQATKEQLVELRTARANLKEARKNARSQIKPAIAALETKRREAVTTARQKSGCYWGNYNAVVASYERARVALMSRGGELQERKFNGSGRIVNQIQRKSAKHEPGMSVHDLFAGARTQVRVMPVDEAAWKMNTPRGKPCHTQLTMNVFTRDGVCRTVTWPMVMHRPIPEDARIKEVVVIRERVADRWEWSVVFTCRMPAPALAVPPVRRCGIDLGWRKTDQGLLVATLADDASSETFLLPPDWLRGMEHVEALASERQVDAQAMYDVLTEAPWNSAPTALGGCWKGLRTMEVITPRRLAFLHSHWQAVDWQPRLREQFMEWVRDDRRLWIEQTNLRRRLIRRRTDIYLCAAKRIAERYGIIVIEDINWAQAKRVTDKSLPRPMRHQQQMAAPGEFVAALVRQAGKSGSVIERYRGVTSGKCHSCETVFVPTKREERMYQCPKCSAAFDQDVNAARNLMVSASAAA